MLVPSRQLLCNLACCCAEAGGLDGFILPMMLGSIGELRPVQFQTPDKHYGASITLIARRSTQRIGTRHWRRGADTQVTSDLPHIVLTDRQNIADANNSIVHGTPTTETLLKEQTLSCQGACCCLCPCTWSQDDAVKNTYTFDKLCQRAEVQCHLFVSPGEQREAVKASFIHISPLTKHSCLTGGCCQLCGE